MTRTRAHTARYEYAHTHTYDAYTIHVHNIETI